MRRLKFTGTILVVLALILLVGVVTAAPLGQNGPSIPNGAQLYDNWMAATGQSAPAGDMPIWARQTTNTRSGPDTWRCVSCHGWDGMGKDGAYRSGANYTGFPNLYAASRSMSHEEIIAALKGGKDPDHNFSGVLDDALLADIAAFVSEGFVDDTEYINLTTLKVIGGNASVGKDLFTPGLYFLPWRGWRCPGHPL